MENYSKRTRMMLALAKAGETNINLKDTTQTTQEFFATLQPKYQDSKNVISLESPHQKKSVVVSQPGNSTASVSVLYFDLNCNNYEHLSFNFIIDNCNENLNKDLNKSSYLHNSGINTSSINNDSNEICAILESLNSTDMLQIQDYHKEISTENMQNIENPDILNIDYTKDLQDRFSAIKNVAYNVIEVEEAFNNIDPDYREEILFSSESSSDNENNDAIIDEVCILKRKETKRNKRHNVDNETWSVNVNKRKR